MIPVVLLLLSVLLFRVAPPFAGAESWAAMAGFSPLLALSLCGGAFFPKKWAVGAGIAAVLVPHVVINMVQGFPVFHPYAVALVVCVAAVAAVGVAVGTKASVAVFLGASLFSTVLFHLVTNTVSFLVDPGYTAAGFSGWFQAQTTGLPGFTPTWVFTLKQLAGDLLFTTAFVLACRPRAATAPAEVAAVPVPAV